VSEAPPTDSLIRLLIIEDDPVMQLGLRHALSNYPHLQIVGQETEGYLGLEVALCLQPDVILMDIGLPQLDGITATAKIKATLPQTRVVVLTSHQDEQETILALANGADAYCIKGGQIEQLVTAIEAAQVGAMYLDPQVRHVITQLQPLEAFSSVLPERDANLTIRELEVLRLLVKGQSNPSIAAALFLSESTVKAHIRSIMHKLGVSDRVQVAVVALRSSLIPWD
jgi:two-component system, NarL family, response regulator LiaR